MQAFRRLTARAAPLPDANLDTDIIFPARFLLHTSKTGLGPYAFHDRRFRPDGSQNPDFVLNQAPYRDAKILICGDNFGCGSSREQAPWALLDLGVRCLISTGFGEIFAANCFKNGMLALVVSADQREAMMQDAAAALPIEIDLYQTTIRRRNGALIPFAIEPWRREALLNGWDEIAIVLNQDRVRIDEFEKRQRAQQPWLYQGE